MKTQFSLIIPCYNEARNLPSLFSQLEVELSKHPECEIIFVNNGSTDNSDQTFNDEINKQSNKSFNIRIENVAHNIGYGHGILSGLSKAKGEILGWTHADLQTEMSDVFRAYDFFLQQSLEEKNIFVKGRRVFRPKIDIFFTFSMQLFAGLCLGQTFCDINAQPKIFSRKLYMEIKESAPQDFSLDLYFMYQANCHQIKTYSIPLPFNKRKYGLAKGGGSFRTKFRLIKRTVAFILDLKNRSNIK